jgi:predicted aspartyl protease
MRRIMYAVLVIGCTALVPVQGQELNLSLTAMAIPFSLASDFLVVVEGQAGDVGGLKFIVDTGATRSIIDKKIASRLQLQRHAGQVMNFDRSIPIEWAQLPELKVGPLRAEGLRVMVVDLPQYSDVASGVDGIIGLDLLSRSDRFTIDYSKKRIYFELAVNGSARPVPGCFVVPTVVQGLVMRLGVDTGVSGIVLYGDRLKKRLVKLRIEGEPEAVTMGRIAGTKVTLPGVQLGGPEEAITVILINGPEERIVPGLDGYLGVAALHANSIEFDFAKMVLRWQ